MRKLLFPAAAILLQTVAFADGGAIQLRREAGDLAITVFTSPVPLSVGLSDISVLIQNRNGLDPVLDADVRLVLHSEASNIAFQAHPTRTQAQNKLLYAAPVVFAKPGKWQITVVVMRHGKQTGVTGTFEVRSAPPRAVSYAGYIAFPPVLVMLFLIREGLIRRKSRV
jgi:hypothetical protein